MPEPPEVTTNEGSDVVPETGNDSVSLITELIDSEMKNITEEENDKTKGVLYSKGCIQKKIAQNETFAYSPLTPSTPYPK